MKIVRTCLAAVAGLLTAPYASAVDISPDGLGEVAIAPFYTVKNGWLTAINLTNTSDKAIAVKVRFREAANSRDVLDFVVGLSAYDVVTAVLRERPSDGLAAVVIRDQENNAAEFRNRRTCTVPKSVLFNSDNDPASDQYGTLFRARAYGGLTVPTGDADSSVVLSNDGGATDNERLKEGYIEFFVLGAADVATKTYDFSAENNIKTAPEAIEFHDCDFLDAAFSRDAVGPNNFGFGPLDAGGLTNRNYLGTAAEFGEPINALKFNVRLLNPKRGIEAGYDATVLANFYNPGAAAVDGQVAAADNAACFVNIGDQREARPVDWRPDGAGASCRNFIAEQDAYGFLEPSVNNAYPAVANFVDDVTGRLVSLSPSIATLGTNANLPENVRGVDAVSALLTRRFVFNEWANDSVGAISELTDWVVTFPTKNFYVDGNGAFGYDAQNAVGPAVLDRDSNGRYEGDRSGTVVTAPFNNAPYNTSRPESILEGTTFAQQTGDVVLRLASAYAPFEQIFDGQSCIPAGAAFFDRAEQANSLDASRVDVSPSPPRGNQVSLCKEANVVTFFGKSVFRSVDAATLQGEGDLNIGLDLIQNANLDTSKGWMSLDLNPSPNDDQLGNALVGTGVMPVAFAQSPIVAQTPPRVDQYATGAPVLGFVFKQRTFGPSQSKYNYASAISHGFSRVLTATP